jgi:hypothetical protein
MAIHGIASSYFGDQEWDIGKSLKWFQLFCDTEYVLDANLTGRPRSFLIAWDQSFPDAKFSYLSGASFTASPQNAVNWRRTSFERADAAWGYDADDWVVFVDTTEALCLDTGFPPEDEAPTANIFLPYLQEEIDNAGNADSIYLPFWAFVKTSAPFRVYRTVDPELAEAIEESNVLDTTYDGVDKDLLGRLNTSETISAYPYYTYAGLLPRVFRASALRDPDFDWASLDTFVEAAPDGAATSAISVSLVSYSYARWSKDPTAIDPYTGEPASQAVDDGYRMRRYISRVRPIEGLPYDREVYPPDDTAVLHSPGLPDDLLPSDGSVLDEEGPEFSGDFSQDALSFYRRPVEAPDAWPLETFPLTLETPIYSGVIRQNYREGLYYRSDQLGPIPWNYISGQPGIDPDLWDLSKLPRQRVQNRR